MKRIASIQDVSCLGRCSQTVALPVIPTLRLTTRGVFDTVTQKYV